MVISLCLHAVRANARSGHQDDRSLPSDALDLAQRLFVSILVCNALSIRYEGLVQQRHAVLRRLGFFLRIISGILCDNGLELFGRELPNLAVPDGFSPPPGIRFGSRQQARKLPIVVIPGDTRKTLILQVLHHHDAAQRGPNHLHAGQLEFDRTVGRLGQIAAEKFAIEHLDLLPHVERGADLRHQLARDIVDRDLAGRRLAFALLRMTGRERAREEVDHAAAVTWRPVLDAEHDVIADIGDDTRRQVE
jgi:hypothetical protein